MVESSEEVGDRLGLRRRRFPVAKDRLETGRDGLRTLQSGLAVLVHPSLVIASQADLVGSQGIGAVLARESVEDLWRDVANLLLYCGVPNREHQLTGEAGVSMSA